MYLVKSFDIVITVCEYLHLKSVNVNGGCKKWLLKAPVKLHWRPIVSILCKVKQYMFPILFHFTGDLPPQLPPLLL